MKRARILTLSCVLFAATAMAVAQDPTRTPPSRDAAPVSPSDLPAPIHPDAWAHLQQMRRYETPRQVARLKAAEEAQQRRARLSAQRWYGYSPLRPIVGATPTMGNYYPVWNTDVPRPFRWYGISHPVSVQAATLDVD